VPPQQTTGRIISIVRRALASAVREAYPTIDDPTSGSVVPGGTALTVSVSTNRPELAHTVRVIAADGSGTVLATAPVTFPGGDSPGTADVSIPAGGGADAEFFLEVVPSLGPSHRIVVSVLAAGTPVAVAIDTGGNPPGEYRPPLDLVLTGAGSGGTAPYTYKWIAGSTTKLSDSEMLRITLDAAPGTIYTFTCEVTDDVGAQQSASVEYTMR